MKLHELHICQTYGNASVLDQGKIIVQRRVLIALGANVEGLWGGPATSIIRAFRTISEFVAGVECSRLFSTFPVGPVPQPAFVNAALAGSTDLPAEALLGALKTVEMSAGRQPSERWGPRPLDLDIIDLDGIQIGWQGTHAAPGAPQLSLPHPETHKRAFVLVPLRDVAPGWVHPVLGLDIETMLRRAGGIGDVRPLDDN